MAKNVSNVALVAKFCLIWSHWHEEDTQRVRVGERKPVEDRRPHALVQMTSHLRHDWPIDVTARAGTTRQGGLLARLRACLGVSEWVSEQWLARKIEKQKTQKLTDVSF